MNNQETEQENKQILLGKTVKVYTPKGWFYRGRVTAETHTHITINDFKTGSDVLLSFEWINELIVEDEGGERE